MLKGVPELMDLNMYGNKVSSIIVPPDQSLLSKLETLNLGYNELAYLPDDLDPLVQELADDIAFGLESNYERGLAIEAYLRNPDNGFRYSTEVPSGQTEGDLADWLFDASDPERFRIGYCEQFATSMGVLARAAGVPISFARPKSAIFTPPSPSRRMFSGLTSR